MILSIKRIVVFIVMFIVWGLIAYGIHPPTNLQGWSLLVGLDLGIGIFVASTVPENF